MFDLIVSPIFTGSFTSNVLISLRIRYFLINVIISANSSKNASAINAVKKSKIPILYIHSDSDNFIPISMMNEYYIILLVLRIKK